MGLRAKNYNIFGFTEKPNFYGGSQKTNIEEGGLPKKGGRWTVCRFKGGGGLARKREGGVFEGG